MVSSPNGRGIILIGGYSVQYSYRKIMTSRESSMLLELSGNSIKDLKWSILDQKLQFPRCSHVAFTIPDEVATAMKTANATNA